MPARLIGCQVRVVLSASELGIFDGARLTAAHPRMIARGSDLVLDHYLEVLMRKPGALAGSAPLDQARAAGVFTGAHEALWSAARARHGEGAGTKALVEVLLLHRQMAAAQVITGINAALSAGAARRSGRGRGPPGRPRPEPRNAGLRRRCGHGVAAEVTAFTAPAGRAVRRTPRPAPSVAAYDQLLTRPDQQEARHDPGRP